MRRNILVPALLMVLAAALLGCGSHGAPLQPAIPNIAGGWEFIATSNTGTTESTGIEVAMKEGQIFVNGMEQPNGQVSASGATQIAILAINNVNRSVVFGGSCQLSGTGAYSLSGSVSSLGGTFNFTYTENGNVFNVAGTLGGDGKSAMGTYSSAAGSACTDSGTIVGTAVPKLAGMYGGKLILPDGTADTVTVTLSEDSNSNLTANLVATSPDNTSFTLTGPVTGNAFVVLGTFQGQAVTYEGYFEPVNSQMTPGIYLVNNTNVAQPAYAGTLTPAAN